ncbi:MAG: hypothetical protein WA902_16605 [Thermosynechococcaceae cyanobacterium]
MNTSIDFNSQQAVVARKTGFERLADLLVSWQSKRRIHHYKVSDNGLNFFLEKDIKNPGQFYMTTQKYGVKQNDCIRVHGSPDSPQSVSYSVLDIDFYADQPDMWIAKLVLLSDD